MAIEIPKKNGYTTAGEILYSMMLNYLNRGFAIVANWCFGQRCRCYSRAHQRVFRYFPSLIFFTRTIDRFGKRIRTGALGDILSDEATTATKGNLGRN